MPSGGASPAASRLRTVLAAAWSGYRQAFIQPDGRVVDPTRGGITTSEGQSYALLRAVWMGDRVTFETVWRWTASHLQVGGGSPFASLWSDGSIADHNSATDADFDIALALLFAARRFDDPALHRAGAHRSQRPLAGRRHLDRRDERPDRGQLGGPASRHLGRSSTPRTSLPTHIGRSPSRIPAHPWSSLVDSSYRLLDECSHAVLDGTRAIGLPPNWCAISRATGRVVSFPHDRERRRLRVRRLPGDVAGGARRALERRAARPRLPGEQRRSCARGGAADHRLDPVYAHDGSVVSSYDDPTVYGGDIGNFVITDPAGAAQIEQVLLASFHPVVARVLR